MGGLQLSLLGALMVSVDGAPLRGFRSHKVRALLAYLAAEADRPQPRAVLAGLLWPDLPDAAALGNLRTALWNLNALLRPPSPATPHLLLTPDGVQFNRGAGAAVDWLTFRDLTADDPPETARWRRRLEAAVGLYRGDFLEGFYADSAPFETWIVRCRQRGQRRMAAALRYLAAAYDQEGRAERALATARRLVELDPWDEAAHRGVMRLAARLGRRGEALAQYEICRQLLAAELGLMPAAATRALMEAIREA